MYPGNSRSARTVRTTAATLLVAPVLVLATPRAVRADQAIFADGFETCEASNWSAATGLPDCSAELLCPTPGPGDACVAGRLFDVETSARLCSSPLIATACTGIELGGPCALAVRVSDALSFVANPTSSPPLATAENLVDGCGRFRLSGFDAPDLGFGALSVDDGSGAADAHALAATLVPLPSGAKIERIRLYAATHASDQAWTTTAGSPFGADTFVDSGTVATIFLHGETPVSGVQLRSEGSPVADDDYYFSDPSARQRSVVDSEADTTGANGSALFVTTTLSNVSGVGSEPIGCVWPSVLTGSAPGLLVVQELQAEVTGDPGTECP